MMQQQLLPAVLLASRRSFLVIATSALVFHSRCASSFAPLPFLSFRKSRKYNSTRNMIMSTTTDTSASANTKLRFCDIGANLLDERFTHGIYRGSYRHEPDLDQVMHRAVETGVKHVILTAGTVTESRLAVEKAREWKMLYPDIQFSSTVGVHPTRCQQVFEEAGQSGGDAPVADDLLKELLDIALDGMKDGTVVAVGEIGLDYDRLEFCPADVQQKYFVRQLETLATRTGLPLFLHNRAVGDDLYKILSEHQDCWKAGGGVVHSFDDSTELAMKFIDDLGLYIGLNGCSLRTDDNLETARQLPLSSILLETDCPYCEVRSTHPGYKYIQTQFPAKAEKKFERGQCVKSRQEPCHVIQVAEIVAGVNGISLPTVADVCYNNSLRLYGWNDDDHV